MSALLIGMVGWSFTHPASFGAPSTETVSQPLTAARAEIQLVATVGRLDIVPTTSGKLIDGTLDLGRASSYLGVAAPSTPTGTSA